MGQLVNYFHHIVLNRALFGVWDARRLAVAVISIVLILVIAPFSAANPAKKPPDVRLLIDISGSMKRNDPNNLRRPALDLLLQLLPQNSKAGVWTFGQWVNMMIPLKPVDEQWRNVAKDKSKEINSVGLFTNIGEALEKASYDFKYKKDDYQTSVILLTDGMVDISRNPEENAVERRRILAEVVKKYQAANARIHTIALSKNADRELLERLAIDTNGSASVVESADELMKAFLRAFEDAVPTEQVPLQDNKFLIDSSIEEFTALVFKRSGSRETALRSPDKSEYKGSNEKDGVRWHSTDDYDLITVSRPLEGEWQILAELDPDNRVTVVSDLSLNVNRIPRNIFLGDYPTIQAFLSEEGKRIERLDFLQLLELSIVVTRQDSGKRWRKVMSASDAIKNGGTYSAQLSMLRSTGDYEVAVLVDGKTFQRRHKQLLSVRDALRLTVTEDTEAAEPTFVISLYGRDASLANGSSLAKIHTPGGRLIIKAMEKVNDHSWQARFTELPVSGEYQVSVKVDSENAQGQKQSKTTDSVSFTYQAAAAPAVVSEPEPLKPEPVEPAPPEKQPQPETAPEPAKPAAKPAVEAPLEESAPQAEAKTEIETETETESGGDWLLYTGLVLGNLLIIGLLYLAYKLVLGSGKSSILEESGDDNADIDLSGDETVIRPVGEIEPEGINEGLEPDDESPEMPDEIIEIAPDDDELVGVDMSDSDESEASDTDADDESGQGDEKKS